VPIAGTRSTRTVQIARDCLVRAIKRAEAHDRVRRNVAALAELPSGQEGRPSKALTLDQARALLVAAEKSPLHAYIVLSLLTGIRPEEARALRWDHVYLDGEPASIAVWRSVRAHGDVKTSTSRRTLAIPDAAVEALRTRRARQAEHRLKAGAVWQEDGLVFTTMTGTSLGPNNIRRDFRKVCNAAGVGTGWAPRELRHSFVSLMSQGGVAVEEIARLAGHATSRTTELVYRKELRPVITTGAEVIGRLLA
jgi:integrase